MDVGVEKPSNGLLLFTTALAGSLFFGEVGAFAMIKYPLSQEFGFKQSYLGIENTMIGLLDTMRQLGNLVGLILFLLFPPHRPKQIFFFFNTAECLMIMVLFLGKSMGDSQ